MIIRKTSLIPALVLVLLIANPFTLRAQDDPQEALGAWYMYFGANRISEPFSIHTEAQFRFWEPASNLNQILLRTGLNIHLSKNHLVTPGYAFILSEPYASGEQSIEHRIFQQYIQRVTASIFSFEHRFRLEQRWVTVSDETKFFGRARYRFLWNTRIDESKWFLSLYDEIFLNFTNQPFGQNRFYAALGHQLGGTNSIQLGYLMNTFQSANFHRLQLMFVLNTDLR